MSLARDVSLFADEVNAELARITNEMAEESKRTDALEEGSEKARKEHNALLTKIFESLGGIDSKLVLMHTGFNNDMKDVRDRLTLIEAKVLDVTHPSEEVTPPHPRPALPR